jgi:hypothetical protein
MALQPRRQLIRVQLPICTISTAAGPGDNEGAPQRLLVAVQESVAGPTLPTSVLQQVVGYLRSVPRTSSSEITTAFAGGSRGARPALAFPKASRDSYESHRCVLWARRYPELPFDLHSRKKSEPRFRGSPKLQPKWAADPRYFACALSAAISASLRNVIAPIWLSR